MTAPFRVIFLDIDGVLNSSEWFGRIRDEHGVGVTGRLGDLDPEAVARFQRLVDRTAASIVISSTWRLVHKKMVLMGMLARRGLRARIAGVTPSIPGKTRGDEIQRWLNMANLFPETHRPAGIVILDDMGARDFAHLAPWLVQTSMERGLQDEHVEKAVEMLARPAPPRSAP